MKTESRRAKCFSNDKFNFIFLYFDISCQNNTILENNTCIKIIREKNPIHIPLLDYNYWIIIFFETGLVCIRTYL